MSNIFLALLLFVMTTATQCNRKANWNANSKAVEKYEEAEADLTIPRSVIDLNRI